MTQTDIARTGAVTKEIEEVARAENLPVEKVREGVARGAIVIPANVNHKSLRPLGIGQGLRTKVNANLGTAPDQVDPELEEKKLLAALEAGADTVMDLSTAGELDSFRSRLIALSPVPVGTVPIYQAAVEAHRHHGDMTRMTSDELFAVIARHAEDGVDFITVHCGVTRLAVERLKTEGRVTDIVSSGGSLLANWMSTNNQENPLYEQFDRLLEICREYDITLSLGDGLRPGCLADASDRAQVEETILLGELTERAWQQGVQVMIEGPGHMPLDQIEATVVYQKRLCHGAPFYVLGPLVTDVAPGYDHITAAIGGAVAAAAGADFLCDVTPAEHLRLPDLENIREGIIATRIAGHAADIVKGVAGAAEWDRQMAEARKALDWEKQISLAIDHRRPAEYRCSAQPRVPEVCTMCGEFCALKISNEALRKD